jgi:hypothetical protein
MTVTDRVNQRRSLIRKSFAPVILDAAYRHRKRWEMLPDWYLRIGIVIPWLFHL